MFKVVTIMGALYLIAGFIYGFFQYNKNSEYAEICIAEIKKKGDQDEYMRALAGFDGRNNEILYRITKRALSWPERVLLMLQDPKILADAEAAFYQIEEFAKLAELEEKYCSHIKK